MSNEQDSILNRGVRAVANLIQDLPKKEDIFELKFPDFVANKLRETENKECISTYVRLLK